MRKKILIVGTIAIVVLFLGVGFLWYVGGQTASNKLAGNNGHLEVNQTDSDHDGLADWEEVLWQTDPKKADTDGDGALDGAEVAANRDPKQAGPNDTLSDTSKNLTLLTRNAMAKNSSGPSTPDAQAIAYVKPSALGNLTIIDPEAASTAQSYGLNFAAALRTYLSSNQKNMAKVMIDYVNTNNSADVTVMAQAATGAHESLENLRSVAVPKSVAEIHSTLVDHLAKIGELLTNMSQVTSEPIIALASAQQYQLEYTIVTKALLDINQYFRDHNVKFDPATAPQISVDF